MDDSHSGNEQVDLLAKGAAERPLAIMIVKRTTSQAKKILFALALAK